ncbi:PaaI family thioesterase [Sphingomonas sp.]|uniref:PaaI family thioesterase n=1 Tax=Sphingomonas sp. TaxID=28214 RepID=UPI0025FD4787|nr:PaaI family thioesterase [Sphingomonas sp.]
MILAFDPTKLGTILASHGHNALIGIAYGAHGDDWVELTLPYAERLVGDPTTGILASGPIFTLMDMASSMAVWTSTKRFRPLATIDMRVDYLRPAIPGKTVVGRGQCYCMTKTIAFVRGEAHDGDPAKPLAHVAGTFMFTDVE